ncbi:LON peptidase substrate-binding domain-containing protein [Amycolatopsis minnesotensis]|uniref:LON peptidase substrate-binding domain-containing protein n=1 Tax=Amycolatopsis minnesotensis TaxID=337894 RepID=A0ABN2S797_9PSEU
MTEQAPAGRAGATLPLFPLQTVLLPGTNLPLHLFEPRYRQLAVDLVTGTVPDRRFGIVALRSAAMREVDTVEHVETVGCEAVLREAERLPDGRFDIIITGGRRFRLLDVDPTAAPYLLGTVQWVDDEQLAPRTVEAASQLADVTRDAHRRYCESAWNSGDWSAPREDASIDELAYLLAADCLLPLGDRQRLLEETHPLRRLRIACQLLTREAGFLSRLRAVPAPPAEIPRFSGPSNLN